MRIFVTGASGFIGSHVVTALLAAGHHVTCCARNTTYTQRLFPQVQVLSCDFIHDVMISDWIPRLQDIDVVVNCVGVLYHPKEKIIWAVHYDTPKALFAACVQAGIKKIVQISALGAAEYDVAYAKSKKAIEDYLLTLPISATILRPSLVYGPGSYGGTSLFRGLASIPWFIPLPGKGEQEFQPIYVHDLARAITQLVTQLLHTSEILTAVGPKKVQVREVLQRLRAWLGFPEAKLIPVPLSFIRIGAWFGDFIPYSVMNHTAFTMLLRSNVASEGQAQHFFDRIDFIPRAVDVGIVAQPSSVQDRWHARLYLLKPLLQVSLGLLWIMSALCSAFFAKDQSYTLLAQVGAPAAWQPLILYSASLLDAVIGVAVLCRYKVKAVGLLQLGVVLFYSVFIGLVLPSLWLAPFAPMVKNIPILVAVLIYLALESDR